MCKAEKSSDWVYEDQTCWVAKSLKGDNYIIVYKDHSPPSQREIQHMWAITQKLFKNKVWTKKSFTSPHWYEYIID